MADPLDTGKRPRPQGYKVPSTTGRNSGYAISYGEDRGPTRPAIVEIQFGMNILIS